MKTYFSTSSSTQDMLNRISNNSIIDFGVTVVERPLTLLSKNGVTLKGTLIGGVSTREWTPISPSDPLYSRFPSGTRDNIWVTTAPIGGPNPFGTVAPIQWGDAVIRTTPKFPTLIWNGEAMTLARSPGYETGGAAALSTTTLIYSGTRPNSYASVSGLAVVGYFTHHWAPEMRTVSGINTGTSTLTCSATTYSSAALTNPRFFYTNVPEELDSPGEYYIDRLGLGVYGRIYFIAPGLVDPNTQPAYVSTISSNPLLTITSCNETISEVSAIGCRHGGIWTNNTNDLIVRNCKISGIGLAGLNLSGNNISVNNVDLVTLQDIGLHITSGNRFNFSPLSASVVEDCNFNKSSILGVHDTSALVFSGAGLTVDNCTFTESPGSSIRFVGNDVTVENCTFTDVLKATRDNGVIYWGRNPSFAGITIRNCVLNYNNLLTPYNNSLTVDQNLAARSSNFSTGIYADDSAGNAIIEDCTFTTDDRGIYMNGGRNVNASNCIFNNCHYPWYYFGALTTPDVFGYHYGSIVGKASSFTRVMCIASLTPSGSPQNMSVVALERDMVEGEPIYFNHSFTGVKVAANASAGATTVSVVNYFSSGLNVLAGRTITCTSDFTSSGTPGNMSVSALSGNVPAGQHIYFSSGSKYVVVAASASTGATTISVVAGPSYAPANQTITASSVGVTADFGTSGSVIDVTCNSIGFVSSSSTTSMSVAALKRNLVAQTEVYFEDEDRFVIVQSDAAAGATSISVRAGVDGGGAIANGSVGKSGGYWQLTSRLHSTQIDSSVYLSKYPELDVYFNGDIDEYRIPNGSSITSPIYNNCKVSDVTEASFYGGTFDRL